MALAPFIFGLIVAVIVIGARLKEMRERYSALSREYRGLENRLNALERALKALDDRAQAAATQSPTAPPAATRVEDAPPAAQVPAPPRVESRPTIPLGDGGPPQPQPTRNPWTPPAARPPITPTVPPSPARDATPSEPGAPNVASWLLEFFTTGNVVAKAGIVVVFFGVAFLVRYTADRGLLPIEYRLIGAAIGALALLATGWRLRHSRRDYAVVLQGGAIGVLYMTIFAAFRLYSLLPASLTFSLLLGVVVCSVVLAVVQSDMALAVLGTSGGFLAPILASTGGGSHVALFSYYAVLNAGVLGIAWFRSWRFLNWIAFVFTFGIAAVWGWEYYQPDLRSTTEPFLVFFFLLFIAVAILFAHRQPPRLRGYIDGSLVFGTPAIAFGMQSLLVGDIPLGRAYSAVVVSAVYLGLARWLWRRDAALRVLAEAFLALAVVFLVLAVPFAFDGHGTAAAWALEGTALVWLGVRQERRLARFAGTVTLIGAGIAFVAIQSPRPGGVPVLNAQFLSGAAIAVGAILAARLLSKYSEALPRAERVLEWVLLIWGLLWWGGAMLVEIGRHGPARMLPSLQLVVTGLAASGCVYALFARRWQWRSMALALIPLGPLIWLSSVACFAMAGNRMPFAELGWLTWPTVLAASLLLALMFESLWPAVVTAAWHAGTAWLLTFLLAWASVVGVRQLVPESPIWSWTMWCIVPTLLVLLFRQVDSSPPPRFERVRAVYGEAIAGMLVLATLVWVVSAFTRDGAAAPLRYLPLLNPLELTQTCALLAAYFWWKRLRDDSALAVLMENTFSVVLAVLGFVAMNASVGRAVHFYAGVPYDLESLTDSGIFHTGISILWAVMAGVLMTLSRRWLSRPIWITGAGLLAVLIVKLFVVDLSNIASVARIVSFLATGILILVIGYFAPVPPRSERSA